MAQQGQTHDLLTCIRQWTLLGPIRPDLTVIISCQAQTQILQALLLGRRLPRARLIFLVPLYRQYNRLAHLPFPLYTNLIGRLMQRRME